MHSQHFTPEQVIEALKQSQGLVYLAAKQLGCSAQTIYNYGKRYAKVREALQEAKGERVDRAELALWSQINNGNIAAIIFYLKTQGKDRGYVERQEMSGPDGGAIPVATKIIEVTKNYQADGDDIG